MLAEGPPDGTLASTQTIDRGSMVTLAYTYSYRRRHVHRLRARDVLRREPGRQITFPEDATLNTGNTYAGTANVTLPAAYMAGSDAGTYSYQVDFGCGGWGRDAGLAAEDRRLHELRGHRQHAARLPVGLRRQQRPGRVRDGQRAAGVDARRHHVRQLVDHGGDDLHALGRAGQLDRAQHLEHPPQRRRPVLPAGHQPADPPGAGGTFALLFDPTSATTQDYDVSITPRSSVFSGYQDIQQIGKPPASAATIDLDKQFLPAVVYSGVELGPDGRAQVDWVTAGDESKADVGSASLYWNGSFSTQWTLVFPPSTPSGLEIPALPTDLDPAYIPPTDPTQFGTPSIGFLDHDAITGYDAAKSAFATLNTAPGTLTTSSLEY